MNFRFEQRMSLKTEDHVSSLSHTNSLSFIVFLSPGPFWILHIFMVLMIIPTTDISIHYQNFNVFLVVLLV